MNTIFGEKVKNDILTERLQGNWRIDTSSSIVDEAICLTLESGNTFFVSIQLKETPPISTSSFQDEVFLDDVMSLEQIKALMRDKNNYT